MRTLLLKKLKTGSYKEAGPDYDECVAQKTKS